MWAELHPGRPPLVTKSGIIVGMGETDDEVSSVMRDLRAHRVDIVTIGQYLQPTDAPPAARPLGDARRVRGLRRAGEEMGFASVFAGPLVRSSYRADEQAAVAAQR